MVVHSLSSFFELAESFSVLKEISDKEFSTTSLIFQIKKCWFIYKSNWFQKCSRAHFPDEASVLEQLYHKAEQIQN